MKIKSILSALLLMVSSVASAQYLNVKLEDGTYRSFKTTPNMKVSFGQKAGLEPTESAIVNVGGHKVTVRLADNLVDDVALNVYVEGNAVKIRAVSFYDNISCIRDDNNEILSPVVSNGFYTFTISNISKDMVATVANIIYTVKFDMSGREGAAPEDMKVSYHQAFTAPTPEVPSHSAFVGWTTDPECTAPFDFSKGVTSDMTLYAKWTDAINGHGYIELAGYKWATENVGGSDVNEVHYCEVPGTACSFHYYIQENAIKAAQGWGSETDKEGVTHSWALPSENQWEALMSECHWVWTDSYNYFNSHYNGVSGYIVYKTKQEGSGYATTTDPHIFLPLTGYTGVNGFDFLYDRGYYWSSDLGAQSFLLFSDFKKEITSDWHTKANGMCARPVAYKQ